MPVSSATAVAHARAHEVYQRQDVKPDGSFGKFEMPIPDISTEVETGVAAEIEMAPEDIRRGRLGRLGDGWRVLARCWARLRATLLARERGGAEGPPRPAQVAHMLLHPVALTSTCMRAQERTHIEDRA